MKSFFCCILIILIIPLLSFNHSLPPLANIAEAQATASPSPFPGCMAIVRTANCSDHTSNCYSALVADQCPAPNTNCENHSQGGTTHYCCCPSSPTPTPCSGYTAPACGGGMCGTAGEGFAGQVCVDDGGCMCRTPCMSGLTACSDGYCAPGTGMCESISGSCQCGTPTPSPPPTPCTKCGDTPVGYSYCADDGTTIVNCSNDNGDAICEAVPGLDCATVGKVCGYVEGALAPDAVCLPAPSPTPTPCGTLAAPACGGGYCPGFNICTAMSGSCSCDECSFCEASDLTLHFVGASYCDGNAVSTCMNDDHNGTCEVSTTNCDPGETCVNGRCEPTEAATSTPMPE